MHDRHINREKYFEEQNIVTKKYVVPFINDVCAVTQNSVVAEIGCGEAGNLRPFLDMGCKVIGIDIAKNKIENAEKFYTGHPFYKNLTLIAEDIYNISPDGVGKFDLIVMRDTLEHIPDQDRFLAHVKFFLKPNGKIFFGFPPWRMPFGGHQQMCVNKFLSLLPYFHLLPRFLYLGLLKIGGESEAKIAGLMEVRDTRISIQRFKKIARKNNYKIDKEVFYLINPNYEMKFKLKVRTLPWFFNIPYIRDFFTTTCYYVVSNR